MGIELSIIIPVFGRWDMTSRCLHALARHSHELPEDFEVIVADNAAALPLGEESSAACPALGRNLFRNFTWLPQPHNRNFAGACNEGARAARGRLIFFLNNDTEPAPGWYAPLAEALDGAQLAAPLLLYPPENGRILVQHAGTALDPARNPVHIYEHFPASHRVMRSRPFQALTGAAWLLPRQLFLNLGGFDESFRNGYEDLDFCGRLKEAGGRAVLRADSHITHWCGQSPGRAAASLENRSLWLNRPSSLQPDMVALLAEDGYLLLPTPWGTWQCAPGPELEAELNPLLPAPGPCSGEALEALTLAVQNEPFWLAGHLALMDALEASGQAEQALRHGARYYTFAAIPDLMQRVRRLARSLGADEAEAYATRVLAAFGTAR